MFKGSWAAERVSVYGLRSAQQQSPDHGEPTNPASAFLNPQKNQAETSHDHQHPELKVLAAMQKLVPAPDALGDRHGDSFNSHEEEQKPAQTDCRARGSNQCKEASLREDGKLDHAVFLFDSKTRRAVASKA